MDCPVQLLKLVIVYLYYSSVEKTDESKKKVQMSLKQFTAFHFTFQIKFCTVCQYQFAFTIQNLLYFILSLKLPNLDKHETDLADYSNVTYPSYTKKPKTV